MNLYGNSLKDWASVLDRVEYFDGSSYVNFTIKSVRRTDEGVYEFKPQSNAVNTDCIRNYILQILEPGML